MASRVTSPIVVGRERERRVIGDIVARAFAGAGAGFVLVGGDAGIGKTRLADDAAAAAVAQGYRVLHGGCVSLGGDDGLPFAPVAEALRGLVRTMPPSELRPLLDASTSELGSLVPDLGDPSGAAAIGVRPDWAQTRVFEGLLALLERLGRERPVLLVVEDLHWADRSTRDVLAFLARTLRDERLTILATYRTDELHRRHPLRPWLAEMERLARIGRLELAPLTHEEVAAQLDAILGVPGDPATVDVVARRSGGNPFYAEELLAAEVTSDEDRLPATLRDVLLVRIHGLSELGQAVLGCVAVAGQQVDPDLLVAATGLLAEDATAGLREGIARQLLVADDDGRISFRHALVREAVYDDLLPQERRAAHERCVRALDARPLPAGAAGAAHLAATAFHAAAAHDLPRALRGSVEAARASGAVFALAEAAEAYDRAIELWDAVPDAPGVARTDLAQLQYEASLALIGSGELIRARDMARLAVATGDGDPAVGPLRAAELRERYARALWLAGELQRSLDVLDEAVSLLDGQPASEASARVVASLAGTLVLRDHNRRAVELGEQAVALAREVGARQVEAYAVCGLGVALVSVGDCERGIGLLRDALRLADELQLSAIDFHRAYANLSTGLQICGRADDAVEVALEGVAWARTRSLWRLQGAFLEANAAEALTDLGRWDEAWALLDQRTGAIREGVARLNHAVATGALAVRRGRLDVARAELGAARPAALTMRDAQFTGPVFIGLVELAIAEGRLGDAVSEARLAVDLMAGSEGTGARHGLELTGLALLALGRAIADARATRDESRLAEALGGVPGWHAEIDRLERDSVPSLRGFGVDATGLAAVARAEVAAIVDGPDPERWAAIAEYWAAETRPWYLALARYRQAEAILATTRSRTAARPALAEGALLATRLGARPLLAAIEGLARAARIDLGAEGPATASAPVGDTSVDPFGLTPREVEVLQLVVEGYSNRRIAAALFMSESTAGVHVSNIIGKLAAVNRVEAAAIAVRHGLTSGATATGDP